EELHLRKELGFRVPRDRHLTGKPRPGRQHKGEHEDREGDEEGNARGRRPPGACEPRRRAILDRRLRRFVGPTRRAFAARRYRLAIPQGPSLSRLVLSGVGRSIAAPPRLSSAKMSHRDAGGGLRWIMMPPSPIMTRDRKGAPSP